MSEPFLRVQSRLTNRDHTLLGWLADHGVLTTVQIAHALYPSLDFAQRRLRKLSQIGLLDRFRPFRAEGGTYPYHYLLGQLGVEIVAVTRGEDLPRRDRARRRRWQLTNRANLPHLLGVNGFFTDLAGYARTHPGASLDRWWSAAACARMGAFAEPGDDIQAKVYTARVRPDGHGVFTDHGVTVPYFVEYDTGTEQLATLTGKIPGYVDLARTTGRVWPVLFWLPTAARERHLHTKLTEAGLRYPVATAARDSAAQAGLCPAEQVWWLHRHPGAPLRLADLAPVVAERPDRAA
jgi:hypothetical protein